jgi:hypothetical protein
MREKKNSGMNKFILTLIQIYLLVSIILFASSLFPSNQTDPKDMRNIWVGTINK